MYERLFRYNIMPLFVANKKGEIVAYNKKFEELTESNGTSLINKTFSTLFAPEKEEDSQKFSLIEYGFFDESSAQEVVFISKKQKKYYLRLWIDAKFDEDLSLAAVEDFTEKRELELTLAQQNKKLVELKDQLQDFNQKLEVKVKARTNQLTKANKQINALLERKNEFINELAHDLRTPLVPITYLIESLEDEIKEKEAKKDLEVMKNNANYLKLLVEDILNLARIDSNRTEFNFEEGNIYDIVKHVLENNKITFDKLKMKEKNLVPKNTPSIHMDKLKITEVLENLVMNATKFMNDGGTLDLSAKVKGKFLEVTVTDDGMGIQKENIEKVFEEFFKGDSARHTHKGHGLGLSICKRIIEKHGGRIWAESKGANKGTSIIFTLRLSKYVKKTKHPKGKKIVRKEDAAYIKRLNMLKKKLKKK